MSWMELDSKTKSDAVNEVCAMQDTIAKKVTDDGVWLLHKDSGDASRNMISLCYLKSLDGYWILKGVTEGQIIGDVDCPLEYLEQAPTVDRNWRNSVKRYWKRQAKKAA